MILTKKGDRKTKYHNVTVISVYESVINIHATAKFSAVKNIKWLSSSIVLEGGFNTSIDLESIEEMVRK